MSTSGLTVVLLDGPVPLPPCNDSTALDVAPGNTGPNTTDAMTATTPSTTPGPVIASTSPRRRLANHAVVCAWIDACCTSRNSISPITSRATTMPRPAGRRFASTAANTNNVNDGMHASKIVLIRKAAQSARKAMLETPSTVSSSKPVVTGAGGSTALKSVMAWLIAVCAAVHVVAD